MSRAQDLFDRLVAGDEAEVLSFIAQPVTEELFLDYKRSANNGNGSALDQSDRNNLAKAISGFGNSEGGVIIWGVDCRFDKARGADVPTGPVHICDPTRFKSWLENATSGLTIPPHAGVRHHAISAGFVVTLIPQGMHAPYQALPEQSYYIRSGSNFAKTPHAVLAGLFGRRPQPSVKQHYFIADTVSMPPSGGIQTQISFILRNYGLGLAQNTFFNLSIKSIPGRACRIVFNPSPNKEVWAGNLILSQQYQVVMRSGVLLAPEQDVNPVALEINFQNPIEADFAVEGMCGCEGGESHRFQYRVRMQDIIEATNKLMKIKTSDPEFKFLNKRFYDTLVKDLPKPASSPN